MRLLLLAFVIGAAVQAQTFLTCGSSAEGTITLDNQTPTYSITAQDNDRIAVRVSSSVIGAGKPVPVISLGDSPLSGTAVAGTDITVFDLRSRGSYNLIVRLPARTPIGAPIPFRVSMFYLNRACPGSPTVACGGVLADQNVSGAKVNMYQFSANQGDVVYLRPVLQSRDTGAALTVLAFGPSGEPILLPRASAAAPYLAQAQQAGTQTVYVYETSGSRSYTYAFGLTNLTGGCGAKTVACGSTLDDTLAKYAANTYTIDAKAGDVYQLRLLIQAGRTFQAGISIFDARGNPVNYSADGNRLTFATAAPGVYTVMLSDSDFVDTASYSLAVARINNPCNGQALGCGSVADASIDKPLGVASYSITADAGDAFLLRALRGAGGVKPLVEVYDPAGTRVSSLTVTGLSKTTFTATAAGTYTVIASDSDGTQTGAFTLSVARVNRPCNATPVNCGATASGRIDGPLRFSSYSYTANAGESFTVRLLDASGVPTRSLEVYDAQGRQVQVGQNRADVVSPAAGLYMILASDDAAVPTPSVFNVAVLRTRNACGTAPPMGQTIAGTVNGAAPFTSYTIQASTGDALLLRAAGFPQGMGPTIDLYDPAGNRLDSRAYAVARTAATTGPHTVILSAPRAGDYSFSWQALNNPAGAQALGCGLTTVSSLNAASQFKYYTIPAAASDVLRLLLTRVNPAMNAQLELYDSAGNRLTGTPDVTRKVTSAGTYVALVSPASSDGVAGSFALAFQRPNNPCTPVSLGCGQTALRTVDIPGQLDTFTFAATAGDNVTLRAPNRLGAFLPAMELYDPAGTLLQTSNSGAMAPPALSAGGQYALLVRDRTGGNTGTYRVSFQRAPACPVNDTESPMIRLKRPTGGEVLPGGMTYRIQWESDDNVDVVSHDVRLSTDDGQTFPTAIATTSGAVQAVEWTLPANIPPSRTVRIQVTARDAAGNSQTATSDSLTVIGSGFNENSNVSYDYDSLNRIIRAKYSDGTTIEYVYDAAGNLTQIK